MKLCIAIDVSKGKSHFQCFKDINNPLSKVDFFYHDMDGFNKLFDVIETIKKEYDEIPVVLFESTGIYHYQLNRFLELNNLNHIIISPLLSSKVRKSEIRGVKTDIKDCTSIASVYYIKNLCFQKKANCYNTLREKSRHYDFISNEIKRLKIEFRRLLDIVFPRLDEYFENLYTDYLLDIIFEYPHPEILNKCTLESIIENLIILENHRSSFLINRVVKIKDYALKAYSGCGINSYYVSQLKYNTKKLQNLIIEKDKSLEDVIEEAKKTEFYVSIKSIPGISDNLASRIIAELGDISRFSNYKKIIAYAGIDPIIYQSGEKTGEHLNISKKGNKKLRYLLYLAVSAMIRTNRDIFIKDYYFKKRMDGLKHKEAIVACMNKLIRLIYALCKNKSTYDKYYIVC